MTVLNLQVDTAKLDDDQLEKFKDFLISIGMYQPGDDLTIPEAWKQKHWWSHLKFPFPRMGGKK